MAVLSANFELGLGDFSLQLNEDLPLSGVTAVFGKSGSGKTSLLRVIAGLEPGAKGRIAVNGEVWQDAQQFLPAHKRPVGYVFQDARLFSHLTVAGNLAYAAKRARSGRRQAFADIVTALDLEALLSRKTGGLSGGERQRVAIGRALASAPQLLLLDEPLSGLDEIRKNEILPCLERVRDETGVPILYVSHSAAEVARLAGHIVTMDAGRVIRSQAADSFFADPEAVGLIGLRDAGGVLHATILEHHADGLSELAVAAGRLFVPRLHAATGSRLRIRIAAQDILIALKQPEAISALNVLAATIVAIHVGSGPGAMVSLSVGSDRLLARITQRSVAALGLKRGDRCFAIVKSVALTPGDIGHAN